jgi:hypothetical protein
MNTPLRSISPPPGMTDDSYKSPHSFTIRFVPIGSLRASLWHSSLMYFPRSACYVYACCLLNRLFFDIEMEAIFFTEISLNFSQSKRITSRKIVLFVVQNILRVYATL